jgi:hypothetical protein
MKKKPTEKFKDKEIVFEKDKGSGFADRLINSINKFYEFFSK